MSSPMKFTTQVEVVEHLQNLPLDKVLENSSLIYTFDNMPKTKELMDQLRFDDSITVEQLLVESHKVTHMKLARMGMITESSEFFNVRDIDSIRTYITRSSNLSTNNKSDALVDVAKALADAICAHTNSNFSDFDDTAMYLSSRLQDELTYSDDLIEINKYWETRTGEQKVIAMAGDGLEKARYEYMLNISNHIDTIHDRDNYNEFESTDLDDAQIGTIESFQKLIENTIRRRTDMKSITTEFMIRSLENQMFNNLSDYEYGDSILESLSADEIVGTLAYEEGRDKITPKGICKMAQLVCDLNSPFKGNDKQTRQIIDTMKDKVKNTLDYQMHRPEYSDLPIVQGLGYARDFLKDIYGDMEDVVKSIDNLMDEIEDYIEESVKSFLEEQAMDAQFNPNPFDVYHLTPLPVGSRTLQRSLCDIACAEDDEALEEAMMAYARLENAYNHMIMEAKGSTKRNIARNAGNKINTALRSAGKSMDDTKQAVKKVVDPMENFIHDTIDKIKKADTNERRNMIIKGGVAPKVMRWLKRGIGLVVVGSAGATGAVIAGIGLLAMIANDSYCDSRERVKILRELEDELKIVEEKIDDSRGDENKQKKYELMRIRNRLQADIDRIKLRLKY